MCGLAGYVGEGDVATLEAMAVSLVHRGPDASGIWSGEHAGLAHRRLSILELSEAGAQPMSRNGAHLTYNGEIYNCRELRHELESMGHAFRGHSDTEVILNGYLAWGDAVVERLEGMFAFAIWDEARRRLLAVRDRVGIKPFFYARHGKGLVFASEIKAILRHATIDRRIHPEMVDAYLALGYVPSPDTIFAGIHSLPPGHLLQWEEGVCNTRRYWQPPVGGQASGGSEDDLAEELDVRLNRAVESHLLADVEVGAFLSGGVDSSLVSAIAQKHLERPIKSFTIGFSGGGDERDYARTVSRHIGSEHHEHLAEMDLASRLPELLWHLEQPLFDNSILPTYLVSRHAGEKVKVVLAGDGGDEPFFGYEWTRRALTLPRLLPPLRWPGWQWAYRSGGAGILQRALFDLSHSADARYLRRITVDAGFRQWLYTDTYRASLCGDPLEGMVNDLQALPGAERFALSDLGHYLPEDVLFKVDRMSMAHSLEVRVPLLDHRLLEWILRLPLEMRFRHGRGKHLLRRVAQRYLPQEILQPRKQGFTIPIDRWLHGELGDKVGRVFASPEFAARGIIRPERAMQLLQMHRSGRFNLGHRIWSIVVLELWFRVWMDGCREAWNE